jgi:DNA-directed RNA polymerase specialized sigma24 family protein
MPEPADLELARAVVDGDFAAFEKLLALYLPPVTAFARRQQSEEVAARALAAEILEAVLGHLEGFSGRVPLSAWVLVVARQVGERAAGRSSNAAA